MKLHDPTGSRRPSSEDGQALMVTVFLMATILVIAALVIDGGLTIVEKRHLQTAADAATLAAAQDISSGLPVATAEATACTYLSRNGYGNGSSCIYNVAACPAASNDNCVNIPPLSGPHAGDAQYVEVIAGNQAATPFITAMTSLVVSSSARSVAAVGRGNPPPYNFVSLNASNENHTLLVKLGGQLTVTSGIYADSSSAGDAFDIFGTGGNISAQVIKVHGGWETHNGDTVTVNGITCPLSTASAPPGGTQPAGCPTIGQSILTDPFAGKIPIPSPGAAACPVKTPVPYNPAQTLNANITNVATAITSNGTAVQNGDLIQIDIEQMLVTAGGGTKNLTVVRAQNGTTAVAHFKPAPILHMIGTGTPSSPNFCSLQGNSFTLVPGTYYGGVCIGNPAGTTCDASCVNGPSDYNPNQKLVGPINSSTSLIASSGTAIQNGDTIEIDNEQMLVTLGGGTKNLTVSRGQNGTAAVSHLNNAVIFKVTPTSVTLLAGTYVMAGGGFWLCGTANLSAPNVLIYNTQDSTYSAIGPIQLDTTGTATLGPQTSGQYQGLTIFQDPALTIDNSNCNGKSNDSTTWDIALRSMANGLNGISGTIYAPHQHAMFGDSVSGTANLAVLTGCIYIDGADSTFDFQSSGLFGIAVQLAE